MSILEIILTIGSVCSAIIMISGVLGLCSKRVRASVAKRFERRKDKTSLAMLRNDITGIYYKYLAAKVIPTYARENLIMLYDAYKDEDGNSYVDRIYKDMLKWEVER